MSKKINIVAFFCLVFLQISFAQKTNVEGVLLGRPFSAQVNHPLAVTMLTNKSDSSVMNLFDFYGSMALSNTLLEEITKKYSIDVSTLFLVEKLYELPANKKVQDDYFSKLDDFSLVDDLTKSLDFLKDFHIVFIPGFNYEENQGNFEDQRKLFDSAGISNEMIMTEPFGLIDSNALIVANQLREINRQHSNILLISISKGGAEIGIALSNLLSPEDITSVKAWINACGILKGSPVADHWKKPLRKMWISLGLFFVGKGKLPINAILNDLSYEHRKYTILTIPTTIYTVNYVVVSLGKNMNRITLQVPNDGFSPTLDAITDNEIVVIEVGNGLNHKLEKFDVNTRLSAILYHIVENNKVEK